MTRPEDLLASPAFDPAWYCKQHDVQAGPGFTDLDAARHFLTKGLYLGLDPSPDVDLRFLADVHDIRKGSSPAGLLRYLVKSDPPAIDQSRLPWALNRLLRRGRGDLALRLSRLLLSPDLAVFDTVLQVNHAVRSGDAAAWMAALNTYLRHYGVSPIELATPDPGTLAALRATACTTISDGPLVTVIVSAWQAETTIAPSLMSLVSQGWRQLEIIVVDDASTDGTFAILNRIARSDARIRLLRNPVNVGPYVSRNIALRHARGSWILCHDADEWAHPDALAVHMTGLHDSGRPVVSQVGMVRMRPDGAIGQIGRVGKETIDGALRPCPSWTIFSADFLRTRLGSWDCARFAADSEMIARARLITGRAPALLARPLVLSLDLPESLTNRTDTGTGAGSGLSAARAAYRAFWTARLATFGKAQHPAMLYRSFPPADTADMPAQVRVPLPDIEHCLAAAQPGTQG